MNFGFGLGGGPDLHQQAVGQPPQVAAANNNSGSGHNTNNNNNNNMPSRGSMSGNNNNGAVVVRNKIPRDTRPPLGIQVWEENSSPAMESFSKDIVVLHSAWRDGTKGPPGGADLSVPGNRRAAIAWQAVHTYTAHDGAEMFVCNICGKDLKLNGTAGSIASHIRHLHPGVMERLEEYAARYEESVKAEAANSEKKRKRPPLPLYNNQKQRTSVTGMSSFKSSSKPFSYLKNDGDDLDGAVGGSESSFRPTDRKARMIELQKNAQMMYLMRGHNQSLPLDYLGSSASKEYREMLEATIAAASATRASSQSIPNDLYLSAVDVKNRILAMNGKVLDNLQRQLLAGEHEVCAMLHVSKARQASKPATATLAIQWIQDFELKHAVLAVYRLAPPTAKHSQSPLQQVSAKIEQSWGKAMGAVKFLVNDEQNDNNDDIGGISAKNQIFCLDYMLNLVAKRAFEGVLDIQEGQDFGELDMNEDDAAKNVDELSDSEDRTAVSQGLRPQSLLRKMRKLVAHFHPSEGAKRNLGQVKACTEASEELFQIAKQLNASASDAAEGVLPQVPEQQDPLPLDNSATWWSTFNTLERLLSLREAVTLYAARRWMQPEGDDGLKKSRLPHPPGLTEREWDTLEELQFMLRPLRFARQMLDPEESSPSSSLSVTTSLVPLIVHLIYKELESIRYEASNNPNVKSIASQMMKTMDDLFGNFYSRHPGSPAPVGVMCGMDDEDGRTVKIHKAILYAHALDPRFKTLSVFPQHVQDHIWESLLEEMIRMRPQAADSSPGTSSPSRPAANQERVFEEDPSEIGSEVKDLLNLYATKSSKDNKRDDGDSGGEVDEDTWKLKCEAQLKRYREANGMPPKLTCNVLSEWWGKDGSSDGMMGATAPASVQQRRSELYPILWQIARRVLCISATSFLAQSAFSEAANTNQLVPANTARGKSCGNAEMFSFLRDNAKLLQGNGI